MIFTGNCFKNFKVATQQQHENAKQPNMNAARQPNFEFFSTPHNNCVTCGDFACKIYEHCALFHIVCCSRRVYIIKIATRVMPTVKSKIKMEKCVTAFLRLALTANSLRPSCAQKRVVNIKRSRNCRASENNTINKKIIYYVHMYVKWFCHVRRCMKIARSEIVC